jgi:hypothetical protein
LRLRALHVAVGHGLAIPELALLLADDARVRVADTYDRIIRIFVRWELLPATKKSASTPASQYLRMVGLLI